MKMFTTLNPKLNLWAKWENPPPCQSSKKSTNPDRAQTFRLSSDQDMIIIEGNLFSHPISKFFGKNWEEPQKSARNSTILDFQGRPSPIHYEGRELVFFFSKSKSDFWAKNQLSQVCLLLSGKVRPNDIIQKIIKVRYC